jgi:uridine kinase
MTETFPVQLIAVVGGSGAGKSWLVSRLCRLLGELACHLQLDDFYRDRSHLAPARRARINFDVPHAIDWEGAVRALRSCRAGQAAEIPRYDFASYSRRTEFTTLEPRPVVFVDGLWLLRSPIVRQLFDLTIFLDTPRTLRHRRRVARDVEERGYTLQDVEDRLRTAVAPMHERYVEPQKRHADIILAQPFREAEVRMLTDRLWTLLSEARVVEPWRHETFRAELLSLLAQDDSRN